MSYTPPCTGINSIADFVANKIGDFDKLPGGDARIQILINLIMYLDSKTFYYFLKTSIFKNINNEKINAFINKIRYDLLIKNYKHNFPNDSPFICACKMGILENVKLLVNNHNVNDSKFQSVQEMVDQCTNYRLNDQYNELTNFTGLMISVKNGNFDIVKYLIVECKANTNKSNEDNYNALHFAVSTLSKYRKTNIIELLLKYMSSDSINQKADTLNTSLDFAYHHNYNKKIIKLLRTNGCKARNFNKDHKYAWGKGDLND
jgi:hypothetical protein